MNNIMQYEQNERYEMSVTDASFEEDGSLCLSLQFGSHVRPPVDELLTTGYVKLSVYDDGEFTEDGTLTLYGRSQR